MGQITIYLDRDAEARAKTLAKARGLSVSNWVAELIRAQAHATSAATERPRADKTPPAALGAP